jgi:hypothetical protein
LCLGAMHDEGSKAWVCPITKNQLTGMPLTFTSQTA